MKRIDRLRELIRVARGEQAPDLVLKGGRVLNLFTGEIIRADVAARRRADRRRRQLRLLRR